MTAAVALGLQGCSDWDDHYDANGNNLPGADATLWEQIDSRQELRNFATLLKKVCYCVWCDFRIKLRLDYIAVFHCDCYDCFCSQMFHGCSPFSFI